MKDYENDLDSNIMIRELNDGENYLISIVKDETTEDILLMNRDCAIELVKIFQSFLGDYE